MDTRSWAAHRRDVERFESTNDSVKEVYPMAPLTRWDPVREALSLRDAMGQLMEQAVLRPGFGPLGSTGGSVFGQMNVIEAKDRYFCRVVLPGINPDDVELTVRQNTLMLSTKVPELFPDDLRGQGTYLIQEVGTGEFSRSVVFPKDVRADAIQAHYERGILALEIPIAEHAQPRRIPIRMTEDRDRKSANVVEEQHGTKQGKSQQLSDAGSSNNRTTSAV